MRFGSNLDRIRRSGILAVLVGIPAIVVPGISTGLAQSNAVLEVTVIDDDTGQAIPGAKVTLYDGEIQLPDTETAGLMSRELAPIIPPGTQVIRINPGTATTTRVTPTRPSRSVLTDSSGKSVFVDLSDGAYRLDAEIDGYMPQRRGQTSLSRGGMLVDLSSGNKANVIVRLKRAGLLSGYVKNSSGLPVMDLTVYLLRPTFSRYGVRSFAVVEATATDEMGHFALNGVEQGRYYLAAGRAPRPISPAAARTGYQPEFYGFSYYPGVSDPATAAYIDVRGGTRQEGIELSVQQEKLYRVRGRIDFGTQPPDPVLTVYGLSPFEMPGTYRRRTLVSQAISTDGRFEINGLPSGTYSLAVKLDRRGPRPPGPLNSAVDDAYFTFEIAAADIDNMDFRMSDATSVRGRVRTTDGSPLSTIGTSLSRLQVGLDPASELQPAGFAIVNIEDGTFAINGISGTYRVGMPLPNGAYISEVRINGQRVPERNLTIPNGFVSDVEILISPNSGSIVGRVVDAQSRPITTRVSGVLLPDPLRTPLTLTSQFTANTDGSFQVDSVPPGNYRIYVFNGLDQSSFLDPTLLEQTQSEATPVRVSERSQLSVNVRVIRSR